MRREIAYIAEAYRGLLGAVVLLAALLMGSGQLQAAGLFGQNAGPQIFLAEVQSYGESELKPDYQQTFAEKIADHLRQNGLNVIAASDMTNEAGRHAALGDAHEQAIVSELHMDAIIHGHRFDRGYAAPKLAHYADQTMGRAYFHEDERIAAWAKSKVPYRLTPAQQDVAQRFAAQQGADMLLFINMKDVDVRLKHSIFASSTDTSTRGKKIISQLDYYLFDASSGRVYEGSCNAKKTAQLVNFGLGQTGKGMDVDALLNLVMEAQAKALSEDLKNQGLAALR